MHLFRYLFTNQIPSIDKRNFVSRWFLFCTGRLEMRRFRALRFLPCALFRRWCSLDILRRLSGNGLNLLLCKKLCALAFYLRAIYNACYSGRGLHPSGYVAGGQQDRILHQHTSVVEMVSRVLRNGQGPLQYRVLLAPHTKV